MGGCAGLVIVDRRNNKQYLSHVFCSIAHGSTEREVRETRASFLALQREEIRRAGIDLQNAEIFIIQGGSNFVTSYEIFHMLTNLSVRDNQITYVRARNDEREREHIMVYQGNLRRARVNSSLHQYLSWGFRNPE